MRDQKSSVSASRSENGIGTGVAGVPALLTRKSSRPSASTARATMRSASPGLETSPGAAMTRRPSPFKRSTDCAPRWSSGRWFSATAAPQRAKISAAAKPMPEAAPVTSTALPLKSALIMACPSASLKPAGSMPPPPRLSSRSAMGLCAPLAWDRAGQWSVSISGNWRVTFEFEGHDVSNVDLVDYH